jgi:hypothetical protein
MSSSEVSLIISGVALLISLTALWVNSLAPFKLKVYHDAPTFFIHKITPEISGSKEGKSWWIPSFDIGISFYNVGRVPGEILDVRIVAEFKGHMNNRKYLFYPKWIVDYSIFQNCRPDRYEWLNKAILREWYPFLLKGQAEVNLHVILEGSRWDQKENGLMSFTLEAISSKKKKWITYGKYDLLINERMFDERSSYTPSDTQLEELRKL